MHTRRALRHNVWRAALLAAAHTVGTQWALENPADRGDPAAHRLWLTDEHGPIWLMPEIVTLMKVCGAETGTFPMCAFGSSWQKFTTLAFTGGFAEWLRPLNRLTCTHSSHGEAAGGQDANGDWKSARAAAYPADFNLYLAKAVASLFTRSSAENVSQPDTDRPAATRPSSALPGAPGEPQADAAPRESNFDSINFSCASCEANVDSINEIAPSYKTNPRDPRDTKLDRPDQQVFKRCY